MSNPIIKCLHCGDLIQSQHRHDFRWCKCESVAIDGGADYCKVSYAPNARYIFVQTEADRDATLVGPRSE